jgi:hypothetical protein
VTPANRGFYVELEYIKIPTMFCGNFCLISFDRFNRHLQLKQHSHQKEKTAATTTFLHNHHSQTIDQSIKRIDHNKTTQPWLQFVETLEELVLDKTARPPYAMSSKKPLAFQPTAMICSSSLTTMMILMMTTSTTSTRKTTMLTTHKSVNDLPISAITSTPRTSESHPKPRPPSRNTKATMNASSSILSRSGQTYSIPSFATAFKTL